MVNRLTRICSNKNLLNKDLQDLKISFLNSNYPHNVIEKFVKQALTKTSKTKNSTPTVLQEKIFLGFNFYNSNSEKFAKKISGIIKKHFGFIKVVPYFKKHKNLLAFFSNKIKSNDFTIASGVYRIPCSDCSSVYIGETGRSFKTRLKEHQSNCRAQRNTSSAVVDHSRSGHLLNFEHSRVIHIEPNYRKRKIAEALFIRSHKTFAGNKPSFNLSMFS